MKTINAKYNDDVFVPKESVELPEGSEVEMIVPANDPETTARLGTLVKLLRVAAKMPANRNSPTDLAAQHDHDLYGAPKRS